MSDEYKEITGRVFVGDTGTEAASYEVHRLGGILTLPDYLWFDASHEGKDLHHLDRLERLLKDFRKSMENFEPNE